MTLTQLRSSLGLHEARQNRANTKYKAAKKGSASAVYWLAKRKSEWPIIQLRKRQIKKALALSPAARLVAVAEKCAANYRKNPGAYHYLAGGVPNTVIDRPTPRTWRSDCSQFFVNVYRMAGLPCPGTGSFLASNTTSIAAGGHYVTPGEEMPGDAGLYGSRWNPHHVEMYVGGGKYIGHGTAPIDSLTPGHPDFHLRFLND